MSISTDKKDQHVIVNNIQVYHMLKRQNMYLGMTLDAKLRWIVHVKNKTEELDTKFKQHPVNLQESMSNPYRHDIQLWGCQQE